ncbi:hypothetical protein D5041_07875 [Verminephrobacter aporrectodeae subsp. tuberculatae]|uniref:hypothetical protein n=1 Tax=Verminephrobacter aporrectodeae TaxID=1110389 RepID=UPI0022382908|nr:hypothetical protein [Verminephrobacter aporrectodeae]MCW5223515.1 hypothetical protein [Verminephrobacter aporrectodeae subsp. tuberculatae]MCW5288980.1 hypothetical protein [Verminephrobacter aporrectodeae subsp. tuberculatae]
MNRQTCRVHGIDLDHDGKRFPQGCEIDLDDEQAAKLGRWLEPVAPLEEPETDDIKKSADGKDKAGDAAESPQGREIDLDDEQATRIGRWPEPVAPLEEPKTDDIKKSAGGKDKAGDTAERGKK